MRTFPHEFSSLLQPKVWSARDTVLPVAGNRNRLRWFPQALRRKESVACLAQLERVMTPHLRLVRAPIDPDLIKKLKKNYTEALPKTVHNASIGLSTTRSAAYAAAERIGLVEMLRSSSLHQFAETISGYTLCHNPSLQIIRYKEGDYVGPHNDHHPEIPEIRDGYIDLQITLTQPGVDRQYLLYDAGDGYFNHSCNVGVASGVSVSMLPFWHQVTPLEVKPGRVDAHRWLLLASFEIERRKQK